MDLEKTLVYGPIPSRRFGWDLGINLLPTDQKLCTFDCVYCQYGYSSALQNTRLTFAGAEQIVSEWKNRLEDCLHKGILIRHTTVSGNGEPTMHPQFAEVARELSDFRNRHFPEIRLGLLSNGYRIHQPQIRAALRYFDEPVLKLDTALPQRLQEIDHPLVDFHLPSYIEDLQKCDRIIIQTMFLGGWNDGEEDLRSWKEALRRIRPLEVQIYTLDRNPAKEGILPVEGTRLREIAENASRELMLPVRPYLRQNVCQFV